MKWINGGLFKKFVGWNRDREDEQASFIIITDGNKLVAHVFGETPQEREANARRILTTNDATKGNGDVICKD